MDVFEAISYSCRNYLDKAIEPEKLQKVLEAARQAPSAKNLLDWRFVIVTDLAIKTKIAHAAHATHCLAAQDSATRKLRFDIKKGPSAYRTRAL